MGKKVIVAGASAELAKARMKAAKVSDQFDVNPKKS